MLTSCVADFYRLEHSQVPAMKTTPDQMLEFAGKDLTQLFPAPMKFLCAGLGLKDDYRLVYNDTTVTEIDPRAVHYSGKQQQLQNTKLKNERWYEDNFMKRIKEYKKGDIVWDKNTIKAFAKDYSKPWAIYKNKVWDLTDYRNTKKDRVNSTAAGASSLFFLPERFEDAIVNNAGKDLTSLLDKIFADDQKTWERVERCMDNAFYLGKVDFRKEARCQFNSIILAVFAGVMCSIILIKFLSALQLGSKRRPAMQDKFVICQVPAYTEGEDQLRKALDSLTALSYDNKRKLICVICDGMVVGGGNDKPTPNIVLDILGVDPKIDPPALPFQSVGEGSAALNYGKVYSGLYEFEGELRTVCSFPCLVLTSPRMCRSIHCRCQGWKAK
jgi:chitin synthase